MSNSNGSPTTDDVLSYLRRYAKESDGKLAPVRDIASDLDTTMNLAYRRLTELEDSGYIKILPADHRRGVRFLR